MGLLNKLKNALFEEEEIEIEPEVDKVVIKDEDIVPTPKKEELPLENDRELFSVENTFDFPDFDEEEFAINYQPPKMKEPKKKSELEKTREVEKKNKTKDVRTSRRERINSNKEEIKKSFKPSPIISPVYGILDKNYKKEDIVLPIKPVIPKKIDVDMVRKKAFGTLEDDIEKTLNEPSESFYHKTEETEEDKTITELLSNSVDESIDLSELPDIDEDLDLKKENDYVAEIEKELDDSEVYEVDNKTEKKDEKYLEDNTLENDLFDLIDSMYDNKEDE